MRKKVIETTEMLNKQMGDALIELLKEKPISKISIEELTKKDNSIKTKHNSFINEINNNYKTEILNNQLEKENIEKVLKIKLAEKENLEKQIFSLSSDLNKINYKKEDYF